MDPLTDDELATAVKRELDQSYGMKSSDVKHARYLGMRYYYRELPQKVKKPRSSLRSTDIPDACDALIAEIMPRFSESKTLCELAPLNSEDRQQAIEEAAALNYVFLQECNGIQVIHDLLQDGLLQRNSVAGVEMLEDLQTDTLYQDRVPPESLALFMQLHVDQNNNESLEVTRRDDHEDGTVSATLLRTWIDRRLSVLVHPPENTFVCEDHDSLQLDGARFVAFRVTPTRSDLVQLGVPVDVAYNQVSRWTGQRDYDAVARDRKADNSNVKSAHKSGEQTECYTCFYWIDANGDGVAELHKILFGRPNLILADEFISDSNLACFSPWPVAHNWPGTGLVDKLEEVVLSKTVFLRQTADNSVRVNNQRMVCVKGQVDPATVASSDPLAPIWVSNPEAVRALVVPNAGAVGYQMLEYMDKIRRERVGSALDLQSRGAQNQLVPGDTAHGVERVMTVLEKHSAQIITNLVSTLQKIFMCMHRVLRSSSNGLLRYYVDGEMRATNPMEWPRRTFVTVNIGASEGERMRKLGTLEAVYQKQLQLSEDANDILVNYQNVYTTLIEFMNVAGIQDPARFFIDPSSPQAQQAAASAAQRRAQAQQQQIEMQDRTLQLQGQLAQMTAENERLKVLARAQADKDKHQLNVRKQRVAEIQAVDESAQGWTDLEIAANRDLGPRGRAR